jgi:putative transposase
LRRAIISSHVYHEIFLHINWHTKDDSPFLVPAVEQVVYGRLNDRCQKSKGVFLHGIGGTETHVHLAISIEPQVTISELVKDLKGGSSYETNQALGADTLGWQRGYGVVSFGKRNLPWVLEYIAHQKEHHAQSRVVNRLERADVDD